MTGTEASNRNPGLSLILPAFNEAESIATAIRAAEAALRRITPEYEVIVINDGSRDATGDEVRREMASRPAVRLIEHETNGGYGAALRTGLGAARFPLVAFTDADLQFDLTELANLLRLTSQYDIVCGYRINREDPNYRQFLSRGYNALVGALLGCQVRDCDCALKVFRREAIRHVLPESANYFANMEILWKARKHGLSVVEVGVRHQPRRLGRSKVSLVDVPRTLATLLPFWWSRELLGRAEGRGRRAETFTR